MENYEEKLQSTVFFIEANSFEQFALWKEWKDIHKGTYKEYYWEEDNSGFWQQIGNICGHKNKPVCVSFMFAKIFGQRVCFYHSTSRYVDNTMIEEWIEKNYPKRYDNNTRRAMTDANNFHLAVHECERLLNIK